MEKTYSYQVEIRFGGLINGKNKQEAQEAIKTSFVDEYNIKLIDEEITGIEEMKK